MAAFEHGAFPHAVRAEIREARRQVWDWLAGAGCAWSGADKVALAAELRAARARRADPPWLREWSAPEAAGSLPAAAVDAVRRVALDAHRLDRDWCRSAVEQLGDAAYVELCAVCACLAAIDVFAEALGVPLEPLPAPRAGEPSRERSSAVGDDGAWVPITVPWQGANIGRALSLVPGANTAFLSLVGSMYAGGDFGRLVWDDRPLSRPQVELLAARVSALNECFY